MADDNFEDGKPQTPPSIQKPNPDSGQNESREPQADRQQPDLGLGQNRQSLPKQRPSQEKQSTGLPMDPPKREENPFSFKHFLSRDSCNGGQNTGAKRKIYTSPPVSETSYSQMEYSRSPSVRNLASNPEMASALPDFVQDHLVVEQCYLRDGGPSNIAVAIENLPDFAVNRDCDSPNEAVGGEASSLNLRNGRDWNRTSRVDKVPLDLPDFDLGSSASEGIPFDLPRVDSVGGVASAGTGQADVTQPGIPKSLPDFLSDGPIRDAHLNSGQQADSTTLDLPDTLSDEQRLQAINDNLRRNLETLRYAYEDECRRSARLEVQLRSMQSKEREDTRALEKALNQVEDNLKCSTRRAVSAENTITRLKQEIKSLTTAVEHLQRENWELRGGEGASGASGASAASASYGSPPNLLHSQAQRCAHELKIAASSAETSLRQLLTGVDNLRVIASSLETLHRGEDRTKDFFQDSDDGAGPGPAL